MEKYTPAQWMLIDLANQYGLDNVVFEERLKLGRTILEDIKKGDYSEWTAKADNPALFTKCVIALQDVMAGRETGFIMGLDVCNSGAALLSVLLHCETGMRNTGLINTGVRPDGYQYVLDAMGVTDVSRTAVKTATVPYMYGSDYKPEQVFGSELFPVYERGYAAVFPEAYWARKVLINAWDSNALHHDFDLPNGLHAHLECRGLAKTKGTIKDYTFTYLHMENRPLEAGKEQGTKSLVANVTHGYDGFVVAEMDYRCNYNPKQVRNAIEAIDEYVADATDQWGAPDELLHLNQLANKFNFDSVYAIEFIKSGCLAGMEKEYLLRLKAKFETMLTYEPFEVLSVHDEFKCAPNHIQDMREVYNGIMADTYLSTWLLDVIEHLTGNKYVWDVDTDMNIHAEILNNDYNLC